MMILLEKSGSFWKKREYLKCLKIKAYDSYI